MELVQVTAGSEDALVFPYGEKQRVALIDCAFSPEGSVLAVSGMHSEIAVFQVASMLESARNFQSHAPFMTQRLKGHGKPVTAVEWLSEISLVSSSADSTVGLFDVATGARVRKYRGHEGIVNAVRGVDGNLFASAGDDGWLRLWDARSGARQGAALSMEHKFPITALAAKEAFGVGKVWLGTLDNAVLEFDLISGRAKQVATVGDGVCGLATSADGTSVFARTFTGEISRSSRTGETTLLTGGNPQARQKYLSRMATGNFRGLDCCISGEQDGSVQLVGSGGSLARISRHKAAVTGVTLDAQSGTVASCALDGSMRVGRLSI